MSVTGKLNKASRVSRVTAIIQLCLCPSRLKCTASVEVQMSLVL